MMRGASYRSLRVGEGSGGAEMTANAELPSATYRSLCGEASLPHRLLCEESVLLTM